MTGEPKSFSVGHRNQGGNDDQTDSVHFEPNSVTYLGDDLYANQPLCELIEQGYQQYFVRTCKPSSHTTL